MNDDGRRRKGRELIRYGRPWPWRSAGHISYDPPIEVMFFRPTVPSGAGNNRRRSAPLIARPKVNHQNLYRRAAECKANRVMSNFYIEWDRQYPIQTRVPGLRPQA